MLANPSQYFLRSVYNTSAVQAMGGYSGAYAVLEALMGIDFGNNLSGPYQTAADYKSQHGYPPTRPEMYASFIAVSGGSYIKQGNVIDSVNLVDIAPTIAYMLNLPFDAPNLDGRVLSQIFA